CELKFPLHVIANLNVTVQKFRHLLWRRIPARSPVAVYPQSESNRINFLTHNKPLVVATPLSFLLLFRPLRRLFRFCLARPTFGFSLAGLFLRRFLFRLPRSAG